MGNATTPPKRKQKQRLTQIDYDRMAEIERGDPSRFSIFAKTLLRAALNPWVWTLLLFSTFMIASFTVGHFIGQHQMRSRIFNDYDVIKRCSVYEVPSIGNTTELERDCGE